MVTNSVGSATSAVAVLTVLVPPTLTAQPQSLTNATGTTATFSATATGSAPLGYQWQLNGLNLTSGGRISGATSNILAITNVQPADAGSYTLAVSNAVGVVTSAVATLTVSGPPVITLQPASQSVAAGNTVTFSVTAAGTLPLSYQWRKNGVGLTNGGSLSGATSTALTLANVQTNDAGSYQVVVTNSVDSVTSAVATLIVTPAGQAVPRARARWCWSIRRARCIRTSSISFSRIWIISVSPIPCRTSPPMLPAKASPTMPSSSSATASWTPVKPI